MLVRRLEEVIGVEPDGGQQLPRDLGVEQERAEDGLLGLDVSRRLLRLHDGVSPVGSSSAIASRASITFDASVTVNSLEDVTGRPTIRRSESMRSSRAVISNLFEEHDHLADLPLRHCVGPPGWR